MVRGYLTKNLSDKVGRPSSACPPHPSPAFLISSQEIFGLKSVEESPTFVMFALKNGVMLGLWSKYTTEPRVGAPAGALEICFPTESMDALYEQLGKKNMTVAQEPTDMDFGRTFVILDPDGHRIRVYKLREER
ncbi:MAG: VOC family protein [Candidatus Neptunochlamydia sp.]|nr:VOC family protein [Candidatus Neptunochlamydia sp.]